jgi:quinol monooxygenase YgiN
MMITLLRVKPLTDKRDAILEVLQSVRDLILGLPGCIHCACYEGQEGDRSILYLEQWETREDLHRHIQSSLYNRVISAMEFAHEAPEIRFYELSKPMGMELIEALRSDLRIPEAAR